MENFLVFPVKSQSDILSTGCYSINIYKHKKVKKHFFTFSQKEFCYLTIFCVSVRPKQLIFFFLLHDELSVLYVRLQLTFSLWNRVCFFFSCSKVEMFFSFLYDFIIFYFFFRTAKIVLFFSLPKYESSFYNNWQYFEIDWNPAWKFISKKSFLKQSKSTNHQKVCATFCLKYSAKYSNRNMHQ